MAWVAEHWRRPHPGDARRLARRFIAGSNLAEALEAIARLRRRSLAFTLDLLGEATITEAEAVRCQAEYIDLIEGLSSSACQWLGPQRSHRPGRRELHSAGQRVGQIIGHL